MHNMPLKKIKNWFSGKFTGKKKTEHDWAKNSEETNRAENGDCPNSEEMNRAGEVGLEKTKKKKSGKKKTWWDIVYYVILALCGGVILFCGFKLYEYYYPRAQQESYYESLRDAVRILPETGKTEETTEEEEEEEEEITLINFELLWEQNEDIYAWIEIPGTIIDYPVLQHPTDDAYYLEYNIDGSYGRPGCIYSESATPTDFSGSVHILYGHNMRVGTMFAGLHNFEKKSFLNEYHYVYIYTPEHIYTYEVFAAVVLTQEHLLSQFRFNTTEQRQKYLDTILSATDSRNTYRSSVSVSADDTFLILSTCVYKETESRYTVHCVLVDDTLVEDLTNIERVSEEEVEDEETVSE